MRMQGIHLNTIAISMLVFHKQTTLITAYPLYCATLLMEPCMQFDWCITVSDASGMMTFEQDGYSQIRTFT